MNNLSNILKKVLLVGFLLLGTMAYAQTTYVVAVGLSNYKYPSLAPSLPCSVGDAKAISHFFHDYNGSKVFMLLNENATRDHILRVLKAQFAKSTVNDEIIFAFSGHGVQGGLTSYDIKDASGVISYNEIQSIMKASKARRKIIFAMACYSGGLTLKMVMPIKEIQRKQVSCYIHQADRLRCHGNRRICTIHTSSSVYWKLSVVRQIVMGIEISLLGNYSIM